MLRRMVVVVAVLAALAGAARAVEPVQPALRAELLAMKEQDQAVRQATTLE